MKQNDKLLRELVLSIFGPVEAVDSDPSDDASATLAEAASNLDSRYCRAPCTCLPALLEHVTAALRDLSADGTHGVMHFAVACLRAFRVANSCGRDMGLPDSPFHHFQDQVRHQTVIPAPIPTAPPCHDLRRLAMVLASAMAAPPPYRPRAGACTHLPALLPTLLLPQCMGHTAAIR